MPARVTIEARYGGGVHKVLVVRIDTRHLIFQVIMTLQDILLVVIFGHGKEPKRHHFGFNGVVDFLLHRSFGSHCQLALLLVVVEDRIHVLPRPGSIGRPVAFPENIQQAGISDALRVIIHLHRLCMITDTAVVRSVRLTAGISHTCANHALDYPEPGFDSPESAQTEGRSFKIRWHRCIDGWNRWRFGFICKTHRTLLCL